MLPCAELGVGCPWAQSLAIHDYVSECSQTLLEQSMEHGLKEELKSSNLTSWGLPAILLCHWCVPENHRCIYGDTFGARGKPWAISEKWHTLFLRQSLLLGPGVRSPIQ